jgi:hypothetical protein
MIRACAFHHLDGRPCGARPLKSGRFCFVHDPDKSDEAAKARRLGGLRRRQERTIGAAYDVATTRTRGDIQRVLDILLADTLSLENTPARGRLLLGVADTALKVHELARFEVDEGSD